ncbi:transcription termination/antitermination NusG family protein [Pseudomonas sp. NPDC098747]|uniref:transcription termination/antitermination NusG family protein n=1 Tax=Pseudomonas sp. NPDC098747 TaxID=3364487 RepID=UPI00383A86D7
MKIRHQKMLSSSQPAASSQQPAASSQQPAARACHVTARFGRSLPTRKTFGMKSWYLIIHNRNALPVVEAKMQFLGIEIYSPTLTEIRARSDCGETRTSEKQLFPGYLFLRFDPEEVHTSKLTDVPGVKGFVRLGVLIVTASDALIDALKQSLLLKVDRAMSNIEFRNISPDMVDGLLNLANMKTVEERQVALFSLLQKDADLLKSSSLYSRICSDTDSVS